MTIHKYNKNTVTIVIADKNKYLVIKNEDGSIQEIGRPTQIIFNNSVEIPTFEEKDI